MVGIYKIINSINGKIYIGLSNNIKRRFMEHKTPSNINGGTTVLSKAFRKYGIENFNFEVVERCKIYELEEREIFYISTLSPEYNMNNGGNGNPGHTLSNKLKKHLSAIAKKQWELKSEAEKNKIISGNLTGPGRGHSVSESTREKLRKKNIGKKYSEDTKQKKSTIMKVAMLGNKNGNKKVVKMCPDSGVVLSVFESIKIAAISVGIDPSGIISVCRGRQKTASGYKWSY